MKMQESILKRVYKMEEKHNIRYAKKDSKAYSCARVFFYIFAAWSALFAAMLAISILMIYRPIYEAGSSEYMQLTGRIVICFSIILLLVIGAVFNALKKPVFTFVPSVAAGIYGMVFFARVIDPDPNGLFGLPFKYYWANFLPLAAVIICSLVMFIIGVRQWAILRKEYRDVSERIYEEYSKLTDEVSEEQWQEFLDNYTPGNTKKQIKKQD